VINWGKKLLIRPHRFSSKDIWYRAMVGGFKSREEALRNIRLDFISCALKRRYKYADRRVRGWMRRVHGV
jgi:hypothetical protein